MLNVKRYYFLSAIIREFLLCVHKSFGKVIKYERNAKPIQTNCKYKMMQNYNKKNIRPTVLLTILLKFYVNRAIAYRMFLNFVRCARKRLP